MADVLKAFPFSEIETRTVTEKVSETVNGKTETKEIKISAKFFPKMYVCNKQLTSGTHNGKFAHLISKTKAKGYHLAPSFYIGNSEAKEGIYIAKFSQFKDKNKSKIVNGWHKCNVYDLHLLLKLQLISGESYGLADMTNCSYILGNLSEIIHIDDPIQKELPEGKTSLPIINYFKIAVPKIGRVMSGKNDNIACVSGKGNFYLQRYTNAKITKFRTDKGDGYDFGDLFLPQSFLKSSSNAKEITDTQSVNNSTSDDQNGAPGVGNNVCLVTPSEFKSTDVFRFYTVKDISKCSASSFNYIKVV